MRRKNIAEINKVRAYVKAAEAAVNRVRIVTRVARKYPFDLIGLATLSKVFALSEACLSLLRAGFPDEAFGLTRSIVECSTNLRYFTTDPTLQNQRSRDYVKYALADKAFWAHYALQQF